MANFSAAIPVKILQSAKETSPEQFKSCLASLNRAPTILLTAQLNLIASDERIAKPTLEILRLLRASHLIDGQLASKIETSVAESAENEIIFARQHAFELYRGVSLWATICDHDRVFANEKRGPGDLITAILMSYEIFAQRLELASLEGPKERRDFRYRNLRTIREKSLMMKSVSNPLEILGRIAVLQSR